MRIGYLMNSFPMTSTTFIRREIAAHEAAGHTVTRYAIRPWDVPLVEPADIAEQGRTTYLLTAGARRLMARMAVEGLRNPLGMIRALGTVAGLVAAARGRVVHNLAYLAEAVALKQHAARDGVDHIHAHFSTNATAVALLVRRLGGPGYSFTVHGPDELMVTRQNALALKVRHARFVVAITAYCRDRVLAAAGQGAADKVHVLRCGIDLDDYPADPPPVAAANQTLLCVGRLCWQKGQILLPEAAQDLVTRFPDLKIVLIGDGDQRQAIADKVAELGLRDHFEFAGWGTGEDVRAAILDARALILPSYAEGLPIVIMEALACQRPAISTRIAGIPELLDAGCGWIVEAGDVPALRQAMADCLAATPETLHQLGQTGQDRVRARHDQAENARALRDLFAATS